MFYYKGYSKVLKDDEFPLKCNKIFEWPHI